MTLKIAPKRCKGARTRVPLDHKPICTQKLTKNDRLKISKGAQKTEKPTLQKPSETEMSKISKRVGGTGTTLWRVSNMSHFGKSIVEHLRKRHSGIVAQSGAESLRGQVSQGRPDTKVLRLDPVKYIS